MRVQPSVPARICAALPRWGNRAFSIYRRCLTILRPQVQATTYFGARMHCNSRDVIQSYIRHFGVWEPDVSEAFEQLVRPGNTVVDIGANIGYYSLLASHLVGKTGSVVAIEASPGIARMLRANVDLNGCGNVRIAEVAVSGAPGEVVLYHGPSSNIGQTTTIESRGITGNPARVQALPLDMILTQEEIARVSLIKIDIEGAERPVLDAIIRDIDRYESLSSILVEASGREDPEAWKRIFAGFGKAGFAASAVRNSYNFASYVCWPPAGPARTVLTAPPGDQTDVLFSRGGA